MAAIRKIFRQGIPPKVIVLLIYQKLSKIAMLREKRVANWIPGQARNDNKEDKPFSTSVYLSRSAYHSAGIFEIE